MNESRHVSFHGGGGGGKPRAVGIFHSCVLNDIWMFPKIGVGPPIHEF